MKRSWSVARWSPVVIGILALGLFVRPAQAEWYVAGQGGGSFPNGFSNGEGVGANAGVSFSDLSLANSVMYGAKVGYYIDRLQWLGIEMEAFNSTPHVTQQTMVVNFQGLSRPQSMIGHDFRVTTWAPINAVVRYQMGSIEPYAGVGLGVFFARLHNPPTGESTSDNLKPGLNTQVGLRWRVTRNLSLFAEWKYNRATFEFDVSAPTGAINSLRGDYSTHIAAGGLGWHF